MEKYNGYILFFISGIPIGGQNGAKAVVGLNGSLNIYWK